MMKEKVNQKVFCKQEETFILHLNKQGRKKQKFPINPI
jgi:hypothetical protein